jgi:hypothetical protein
MTRKSTRRAILAGATAAVATSACTTTNTTDDTILPLWREWRETVYQEWALMDEMHRISSAMPAIVRYPRVLVFVGRNTRQEFWAGSVQEITDLLVPKTGLEPWHRRYNRAKPRIDELSDELQRRILESQQAHKLSGYDAAEAKLTAVLERQNKLEGEICASPSGSPLAAAIQLDLALAEAARHTPDEGFNGSWFFVGGAIDALAFSLPKEVQQAMAPAAMGNGRIRDLYRREVVS